MTDAIHHLTRVVNRAVVSTELNDGKTEWTFRFRAAWVDITYRITQVRFVKAVCINPADKTKWVTRRF